MLKIRRNPSRRELAWFGLALTLFFGVVGAIVLWRTGSTQAARALWIAGGAVFTLYYTVPPLRRPLYIGWSYLTFPLGWLLSYLALITVFYGVLTPIGLLLRLLGRDPLGRRRAGEGSSSWVARPPPPDSSRYFRQF
jgi:hypothetical protein